ncbi:dihydrodiol dehydrogenase [Penicillium malachiteum]|nr:dihydrodiol dehydrogenase [Penicillium malachiteum]
MLTYQGDSLSDPAIPDERKTSSSAFLSKEDPVVSCIGCRALDFHGGPQRALGDYGNPQLVKYAPGEKNDLHVDWWLEPQNRGGRLYNRRTTILAYLDDRCTEGETYFPYITGMNDSAVDRYGNQQQPRFWTNGDGTGLYVAPRRGNAVFWVNLKANGQGDERTLHAALPAAGIVQLALENGYRHVDAALIYGNEKEVGQGIAAAQIPRSSLWVTSKLWNDAHKPAAVRPTLEKTLHDLGMEYLDLYLMHWPIPFKPDTGSKIVLDNVPILETWWEMESLVRDGLVRQIGVSNFNQAQVEQLLRHARIRPTVHEFETHPFLHQQEFVDWNLEQGLRVIAYSPLGNMNPIYQSSAMPLLNDPFLSKIADKKGITVAQLALAWNMHRGVIVIPKSDHGERVLENFEAQSVVLSDEEMKAIDSNDRKMRFNNPTDEWGSGKTLYAGLDGVGW